MHRRIPRVVVVLAALLLAPAAAQAQVRGEITGPGATHLPIAVPGLKYLGGEPSPNAAADFARVLAKDLDMSGLFQVINPKAYIEDAQAAGLTRDTINFDNWRAIGAMGLVRGGYYGSPTGITIESRFFDVADQSSSGGMRFTGDLRDVPQMAHRMADAIIDYITGRRGPFASTIAFVSNRSDRFREIHTYTFDGRVRQISHERSITMAPSWHPGSDSVLFTSFRSGRPSLYLLDPTTGQQQNVATQFGVNVGGVYSPDGRYILLSREVAGNADIYVINVARQKIGPLTSHWGIDVDPAWSPDGRQIAFCSSRAGTPQIYRMNADGSDVTRVTFRGDYNCSPAWSPDGRTIAYAGRTQGGFQIFTVAAAGGEPRQITWEGSNEDPTWSPDSRYVAFSRSASGRKKIFMADSTGRWVQQLTDGPGEDTAPSWSPYPAPK